MTLPNRTLMLLKVRDELVDRYLQLRSRDQLRLDEPDPARAIAQYLAFGDNTGDVPIPIRQAQENVLAALGVESLWPQN